MSLNELLSKLKEKQAEASINLEEVEPRMKTGVDGIIRAAQRDIKELKDKYQDAARATSTIIAVTGPGAKLFADIAKDKFKTLTVNYSLIIERLTEKLKARGAREPFGGQEFFMLNDEMAKLRVDYNLLNVRPPQSGNNLMREIAGLSIAPALESIFELNYGGSLHSAIVAREIGTLALKEEFNGTVLPVVVYNFKDSFDKTMLNTPVATFEAPEDVTEDFVKTKLTEVKSKLKGRKAPKQTEQVTETENGNE